jgi:hypothetical protein
MPEQNADYALCDGPVCVECCVCRDCGRKVGTPHIAVCACPPTAMHWRCAACASKRAAAILTGTQIDGSERAS